MSRGRRAPFPVLPARAPRKLDGRFGVLTVNNTMDESPTLALLKPTALAAQLGVSRAWLYQAAKTGRIPSIRIGGEDGPLRFVPEDIQRWLDDARAEWVPGRPTRATKVPSDVMSRTARTRSRARR
jgi:predicted DNA-binding transcriptional regulator AlpA